MIISVLFFQFQCQRSTKKMMWGGNGCEGGGRGGLAPPYSALCGKAPPVKIDYIVGLRTGFCQETILKIHLNRRASWIRTSGEETFQISCVLWTCLYRKSGEQPQPIDWIREWIGLRVPFSDTSRASIYSHIQSSTARFDFNVKQLQNALSMVL